MMLRNNFIRILGIAQFVLGFWKILTYGFVGQDYGAHYDFSVNIFRWFNYSYSSPPSFYWLPRLFYRRISEGYFPELYVLAILVLNIFVFNRFLRWLDKKITNDFEFFSLSLLLVFVPFRFIHSIVFASDALTFPIFFMTYLAIERILSASSTEKIKDWAWASTFCCLGVIIKYTFAAMAAVFLIFSVYQIAINFSRYRVKKKLLIFVLGISPISLFGVEMIASRMVGGYTTNTHWGEKEKIVRMTWKDILLPKARDIELFDAPIYWEEKILENHRYSYSGLLYLTSFTDVMNIFQKYPDNLSIFVRPNEMERFFKTRSSLSQQFNKLSLILCLPLFLMGILGLFYCFKKIFDAVMHAFKFQPVKPVHALSIMAFACWAQIVVFLPRVEQPYLFGYFLPRLVIPSLLFFFVWGFLLFSKRFSRLSKPFFIYSCIVVLNFILIQIGF